MTWDRGASSILDRFERGDGETLIKHTHTHHAFERIHTCLPVFPAVHKCQSLLALGRIAITEAHCHRHKEAPQAVFVRVSLLPPALPAHSSSSSLTCPLQPRPGSPYVSQTCDTVLREALPRLLHALPSRCTDSPLLGMTSLLRESDPLLKSLGMVLPPPQPPSPLAMHRETIHISSRLLSLSLCLYFSSHCCKSITRRRKRKTSQQTHTDIWMGWGLTQRYGYIACDFCRCLETWTRPMQQCPSLPTGRTPRFYFQQLKGSKRQKK